MRSLKIFKNLEGKYGTLLSLYLAQSIPMTFFSTVMPVIMRTENYSLTSIGLIQLIKLPWILKFLWAPLVDKSAGIISKYKKWIITSELVYAVIILGTAFLDIEINFTTIIVFLLFAFTASATQDIATDAFAVLILKKEERSLGNSMQSAGSFLGTVTGSGVMLIIYHYFGWSYLLIALAAFVIVALIPLYFYKPKKVYYVKPEKTASIKDIGSFFKQKFIWRRILLLLFYYSGIIGILTMIKPWMVDLNYSIKDIGIISGIYGALTGALTAIAAGFIIRKIGKKRGILLFSFISLLVATYALWLSHSSIDHHMLILGVMLIWGTYGMASVVIYTISMDNVRPGREGTDFTIQIVITHIGSLFLAVISGKIAHNFEYSGLFLMEVILGILVLSSIPFLYKEKEEPATST